MRFLIEKIVLPNEVYNKYIRLAPNKQLKFAQEYVKQHPNYKNLSSAQNVYADYIYKNGFNDNTNEVFELMERLPVNISSEMATLILNLIDKDSLDVGEDWLYDEELYRDGNEASILYKIKALTYASNTTLQQGASDSITPEMFYDNGKLMSAAEIKQAIDNITIEVKKKKSKETKTDDKVSDVLNDIQESVLSTLMNSGVLKKDAKELVATLFKENDDIESLLRKSLTSIHNKQSQVSYGIKNR